MYDVWTFTAAQGQQVTIDLSTTTFDPLLIVLDPSFVPIAANDDVAAATDDASLTYTLTSSGTWTVIVNSLNGGTGDYFLSLTSASCTVATQPRRRSVRH